MPMVGRPTAGIALSVALLCASLAACGGGSKGQAAATERTTTTRQATTTTEKVDPTKVPTKITKPYLDAVFKELQKVVGDARREIHAANDLTKSATDKLDAVYSKELSQVILNNYAQNVGPGLTFPPQPDGDAIVTTNEVISATPTCVFASVHEDFSPVTGKKDSVFNRWIALQRRDSPGDQLNSTPWVMTVDGANEHGSMPDNPCAA